MALDLPAGARDELVGWRERALGLHPGLRLVAPEALHVTLVFLGYVPEAEIARVAGLLPVPRAEPPLLRALGIKPVPPRGPRLFALDLDDAGGRAAAIQAATSDALEAAGLYEPERRTFWPHVTLARVRKGARVRGVDAPPVPTDAWHAEALTLYRSRLSREGAAYEALRRVPLGS